MTFILTLSLLLNLVSASLVVILIRKQAVERQREQEHIDRLLAMSGRLYRQPKNGQFRPRSYGTFKIEQN